MADKKEAPYEQGQPTIKNVPPQNLSGDIFHLLLRAPLWMTVVALCGTFLTVNLFFTFAFALSGGIANARHGSLEDAFFFSVQTLGTIGYGTMYPVSRAANLIVTVESLVAMVLGALITGVVFARFSIPHARVAFSKKISFFLMDGEPTLAFRVGNERQNAIVEAQIRVSIFRTEKTREGQTYYRMYDLELVRDRTPALGRTWTVLHRLNAKSPLFEPSPKKMKDEEIELVVSVVGIDGTSAQTIHARHRYDGERDVAFAQRPADMLTTEANGQVVADYALFHETVDAEWNGAR